MTQKVKRAVSILAIVVASAAAGMILTADLGFAPRSKAQERQTIQTNAGPVSSVTIPSFADVAQRVMPAVVSITTTEVVKGNAGRERNLDPFDFFFPDPRRGPRNKEDEDDERRQQSGGSGFIISSDGYILTNNHVVEGATKVEVHYGEDDTIAEAKIIGRDPSTDLALIKINVKEELPTVRMGDSDKVRVGDWALAIGNPLQFANTLTVGVISAKGRALGISEATQSFENFIQTDAAINFGNSGGPLMNINGEVIGINTAIRAYAQNLGFATPVNIAKRIYPQLKEKGKVTRGYLGIRIADVDLKTKEAFGLSSTQGVLVQSVENGQAAEKAGILPGDVIIQVDSQKVRKTRDLIDYVSDQPPGSSVRITLLRNGQQKTVTAKTAERPNVSSAEEDVAQDSPSTPRNKLGISVQEINQSVRQQYGIGDEVRGIVITDVKDVSPAGEANLAEGDVITEANGQRITTIEQFRQIVENAKSGQYLRLYITRSSRGGGRSQSFFSIVQVP